MLKRLLAIGVCLCLIPVAAWAFYKPTRVLAPELAGVTCVSDVICLEDVSRHEEAARLYDEAFDFVNSSMGAMARKARVIFCASAACFQSFGIQPGGRAHRRQIRHCHQSARLEGLLRSSRDDPSSAGRTHGRFQTVAQPRLVHGRDGLLAWPRSPGTTLRALAAVPFGIREVVPNGRCRASLGRGAKAVGTA